MIPKQLLACTIGLFLAGASGCGSTNPGIGTIPVVIHSYTTITTVVGTGKLGYSGDGGPALNAQLYQPYDLTFDAAGNLYIADGGNDVYRKVSVSNGVISTIAGVYHNSGGGFSGNGGPATAANFYGTFGVTVDPAGNLYLTDEANNVIRRVAVASGTISNFAGNGAFGGTANGSYTGDGGLAALAGLHHPMKTALDFAGNLYICDWLNGVVRKVSAADGTISTVAGNHINGYSGDGGLAINAELSNPMAVIVDSANNLYIAEQANNTVRKVTAATGVITTVAGTAPNSNGGTYSGDGGPATQAHLSNPTALALDPVGNLIIADTSNMVVRRVNLQTGIIDTIAGNHVQAYGGDGGPATAAQMNNPNGLAFDATGNLYISDSVNGAIRKVLFNK